VGDRSNGSRDEAGKPWSFLKKEPKISGKFKLAASGKAAAKWTKVFCFFFSKKKSFLLPPGHEASDR
jgi:hypothetical protein